MAQSCRTCVFLKPRSDGKAHRISDNYECLWRPFVFPTYPDSVTTHHAYQALLRKRSMWPDEGVTCPTYDRKPKP